MRYISIGLGALTIVLGVLPGLFVKERYYEKETSRQPRQPLIAGLKQTLTTRPFLWIILIVFTNTCGFGLVGTLGFYLNTYYVCRGDIAHATTIASVVATALTGGLSGVLLVASGFDVSLGSAQSPAVLHTLKLLYIWIPVAFLIGSLLPSAAMNSPGSA